jgi:hopanoid-associated phosphorylase
MGLSNDLPIVVVTGLAFEARVAAGLGVVTVCGSNNMIAAGLSKAIGSGCRGVVSFGIAGGLSPHIRSGGFVVARAVITEKRRYDSHTLWTNRLLELLPHAMDAHIAAVSEPVCTPAQKHQLAAATGAIAVDMESGIAAEYAHTHGLPFAALRVVADPVHRALPPAARLPLRPNGTPDLSAVMLSLMKRPHQLGDLIRVGRDAGRARAALNHGRRAIGAGFGFHDLPPVKTPDIIPDVALASAGSAA